MATLTTLYAASPLESDDANRLAFTDDTTETLSRALDNVDADFGNMNTLTWLVQARTSGAGTNDIYQLLIRIVNGATILAAANSGGTFQEVDADVRVSAGTTDTNYGPTGFTYVNTSANKTTWDGASVELQQVYTKTAGFDVIHIEVDIVTFDGTYTIASAVTVKQLAALGVG